MEHQKCSVCQSGLFTHDDISGFMFCSTCGTELSEYVPVSLDEDDYRPTTRINRKKLNIHTTLLGNNSVGRKTADNYDSLKLSLNETHVMNLLIIFQAALQTLANAVATKAGIETDSGNYKLFMEYVQKIWFDYINKWNTITEESKMNITDPKALFCTVLLRVHVNQPNIPLEYDPNIHLVYPSKFVLLAIIYIALRQLKSWVILADIVRWTTSDGIPYIDVYAQLPPALTRSHPLHSLHEWIFKSKATTINPSIILYYSTNIAKRLNIELPALNAPLIAANAISQLGLPSIIWNIFRQLIAAPYLVLHTHYPEDIMAVIIIALKLNSHLPHYSYERQTATGTRLAEMPVSVRDIDNCITRNNLLEYLEMTKMKLIDPSKIPSRHNKSLVATTSAYNKFITASRPSFNNAVSISKTDDSVQPSSHVVLSKKSSDDNDTSQSYLKSSSLQHRKAFASTLQRPLTSYFIYDESDEESEITAAYRVLLERLAKYLYSTPPILHRRVSLIEQQLSVVKCSESFRIPLPEDASKAEEVHMRLDLPPTKNLRPATTNELKSVLQTACNSELKVARRSLAPIEVTEHEVTTQSTPDRVLKSVNKKAKIGESHSRSSLDTETIKSDGDSIEEAMEEESVALI